MMGVNQLFSLLVLVAVSVASHHSKQMDSKEFTVGLSWDGKEKVANPAIITLAPSGNDVELRISAPFYNDPAPPGGQPGQAFFKLWEHEVVEAFFLNSLDEYLELEFGPHGQHLMLILNGNRNAIKHSLPMYYEAKISDDGKSWTGQAIIPGSYFPPNVTKFNGYAIHGPQDDRKYQAVFEVSGPQADFHRINKFGDLNLAEIIPSNRRMEQSGIWKQALTEEAMQQK